MYRQRKLLKIALFYFMADILLTYHEMSNIMGFGVKVFVYKHFSSSTPQNVPTWNLKHQVVYKTLMLEV